MLRGAVAGAEEGDSTRPAGYPVAVPRSRYPSFGGHRWHVANPPRLLPVRYILRSRRLRTVFLWALALVVILLFGRALSRSVTWARDGAILHTATSMWVDGEDPYDPGLYMPRFREASGDTAATAESAPALYPPSAYLILAPWGVLPWNLAKYVLLLANLAGLLVLMRTLPWMDGRGPPLSAAVVGLLVLGWSPVHTSLAMGQVTILIGALVAAAAAAMARGRVGLAAIAIALAACLKPQLGVLFLLPLLVYGGFRAFLLCCLVGLALLGTGGLRFTLLGIDWPLEWVEAVGEFRLSGEGDTALGSQHRILLLGLELVVAAVVPSKSLAALASWGVALGAMVWAWVRVRAGTTDRVWLTVIVCVATLLPGYHRFYDAVLLLIPAYWLVHHWGGLRGGARWVAAGGCAVFFVLPNSQAMLRRFEEATPGLLHSELWAFTVQIHHTWALVALLAGLLLLGPREGPPQARGDDRGVP